MREAILAGKLAGLYAQLWLLMSFAAFEAFFGLGLGLEAGPPGSSRKRLRAMRLQSEALEGKIAWELEIYKARKGHGGRR